MLQRHHAWPLERPRWRSHAGAWERAKPSIAPAVLVRPFWSTPAKRCPGSGPSSSDYQRWLPGSGNPAFPSTAATALWFPADPHPKRRRVRAMPRVLR